MADAATRTPKPEWVQGEYGAEWRDIVRAWPYEVLDFTDVTADYQGDITVLLRDGDRYGFLVIGYGSCSGCDALQDVAPWQYEEDEADWSGVVALAEETHEKIEWADSAAELATHLEQLDSANYWWLHDDKMKAQVTEYLATLRAL